MKTYTLETAGAAVYDVEGPLPTADQRPPLFMIGQPMDAGGFRTLASYFPDRTVVTYDPRGLGRSIAKTAGSITCPPSRRAMCMPSSGLSASGRSDVASSGGAVTSLALVAAYPNDVTVLVAHEPPLVRASRCGGRRASHGPISGRVRGQGQGVGMAAFIAMTSWQEESARILRASETGSRSVRNAERGRRLPGQPLAL